MQRLVTTAIAALALAAATAYGQIDVGSDGSDGAFSPSADITIDLSTAPTGNWDDPGGDVTGDGISDGIYDPVLWAVVFKYTSVNISSYREIEFKNHPTGAPVAWLVQTEANINGSVLLGGGSGRGGGAANAEPGPGGFRGGRGSSTGRDTTGAGFGPGGGFAQVSGQGGAGSYSTQGEGIAGPVYGNARIQPLIGGSGGAGGASSSGGETGGGGAGGGAILIGANDTIRLTGTVSANGGSASASGVDGGSGAGGAIRLVSDVVEIESDATLSARGGTGGNNGGDGRIRVEGNTISPSFPSNPIAETGPPAPIWPDATTPTITSLQLDVVDVPADAFAGFSFPFIDLAGQFPDPAVLTLELANIPLDAPVIVRVTPRIGDAVEVDAVHTTGDTWEAPLTVPTGISAVQVYAELP